jgi:hypothetical protein
MGLLLVLVPLFLLIQGAHWIGFFLDDLFFRGYREVEVREPLFIVGLPRSGTSFLHRVLARDTRRFTTLRLWELLLAPSVTERKLWMALGKADRFLGRPFVRLAAWGERRGLGWLQVIHEVSLDDPEEDYFLLLPVFACFLLVVPFPFHEDVWRLTRFDDLPMRERGPVLTFYTEALRRHLYVAGPDKQLLSKNPSFTPFLRSLMTTFPDGRIICCVRDPLRVVPSLLSSIQTGADLFGYQVSDPRVRDRFVDMLDHFSHHALSTSDTADPDRFVFAPLPSVRRDVKDFVLSAYRRFGWDPDPEFLDRLAEDSRHGRSHRSRHHYSLQEFGLAEEEIRRRFDPLIERFGFASRNQPSAPTMDSHESRPGGEGGP